MQQKGAFYTLLWSACRLDSSKGGVMMNTESVRTGAWALLLVLLPLSLHRNAVNLFRKSGPGQSPGSHDLVTEVQGFCQEPTQKVLARSLIHPSREALATSGFAASQHLQHRTKQ